MYPITLTVAAESLKLRINLGSPRFFLLPLDHENERVKKWQPSPIKQGVRLINTTLRRKGRVYRGEE